MQIDETTRAKRYKNPNNAINKNVLSKNKRSLNSLMNINLPIDIYRASYINTNGLREILRSIPKRNIKFEQWCSYFCNI